MSAKTISGQAKGEGKNNHRVSGERPVLVCGGAGFVGTHLCSRLLTAGHQVICVDNFCTSNEESVAHLIAHPLFTLRRQDVGTLREGDIPWVSAVYNLACAASPVHYQREPLDTLFSSIHGMNNLLRIAKLYGAPIFQASTSEIYGHPTIHPQEEAYWGNVNCFGPRSCYDEGKRCAETLCYIYQRHHGVTVRIARIFNTYGPGMMLGDGRVIVNFIVQALTGAPLTLYGDGSQTRSFCYVDDLVEGIVRLMSPGTLVDSPVNLGNPEEITVAALAARILAMTGSHSKIVHAPLPVDDPPKRRPNIQRAMEGLGWAPAVDLDSGLRRTINDVRRRLQLGAALSLRAGGSALRAANAASAAAP